jgi:predicted PurR-regulated permease PerM
MSKNLTRPFLLILLAIILVAVYFIFRPFLTEILVAAILVSVFYGLYEKLLKIFKGRRHLTSLLMCFLLVIIIILPLVRLIVYAGQESTRAYSQSIEFFNQYSVDDLFSSGIFSYFDFLEGENILEEFILDILSKTNDWLVAGATIFIKETTSFVISLILIVITMYFFFIDGKKLMEKLMYLSPLPNKYDKEIFKKFRQVSYTGIIATFVTALGQGVVGAIGFAFVGFPALFAGIIIGLLSLLPYIGSMIFYIPMSIYYLLNGQIWEGIFIFAWGMIVIGNTDHLIRALIIKKKAQVNPIFIILSIIGGISIFGFWGVVIGPLIIAIIVTIFHIYELEYCKDLNDSGCENYPEEKEEKKKKEIKKINNKLKTNN